jgi:hypothetical protein
MIGPYAGVLDRLQRGLEPAVFEKVLQAKQASRRWFRGKP